MYITIYLASYAFIYIYIYTHTVARIRAHIRYGVLKPLTAKTLDSEPDLDQNNDLFQELYKEVIGMNP